MFKMLCSVQMAFFVVQVGSFVLRLTVMFIKMLCSVQMAFFVDQVGSFVQIDSHV